MLGFDKPEFSLCLVKHILQICVIGFFFYHSFQGLNISKEPRFRVRVLAWTLVVEDAFAE